MAFPDLRKPKKYKHDAAHSIFASLVIGALSQWLFSSARI